MTAHNGNIEELDLLFHQWCERRIADKDIPRLIKLLHVADEKGALPRLMKEAYLQLQNEPFFAPEEKKKIFRHAIGAPLFTIGKGSKWIYKIAVAAAVLLFIGGGYYIYRHKTSDEIIIHPPNAAISDLSAPTKYNGFLHTESGKSISYNDAQNGEIADEGNVKIIKHANGNIAFTGNATENITNTLSVPKGSKPMRILLADGTSILLNVASTLTFPNAFTGNERTVTLSGEAYFEVKHDAEHPFIVEAGKNKIKVLGTHFNVTAYGDDSSMKVTLVEGKVDVDNNMLLKPGEQAVIVKSVAALNAAPNIQSELAWTNDEFNFDGESLKSILSTLSKWYNFSVAYQSAVPEGHFSGVFNKNNNLSQVLKILESGGIRFRLEKDTLIVL